MKKILKIFKKNFISLRLTAVLSLLVLNVQAFAPASFDTFREDCLRLQKDGKYAFLGEYYALWASKFASERRLYDLAEMLVERCPRITARTNILLAALAQEKGRGWQSGLELEAGKTLVFMQDYGGAARHFAKSKSAEALWWSGEIAFRQKDLKKAEEYFTRYLAGKTQPAFFRRGWVRMGEIALEKGDTRSAWKNAMKSSKPSADRSILLCRIYKRTGEKEKYRSTIDTLKKKYSGHPAAAAWLKTASEG